MADQYKVVHGVSNHAILCDLEWLETEILRSGHSLTQNTCKTAEDMAIVTMERE